ncbi:hypothetical protein [Prevotella sp. HUN102]|uniref:hypothetical protein n=1 Tax=Prevotella sp. HUN102 TaxID=1392486 RepID=UPI00048B2A4B|nr:hypothetical protein [Prevotella sp. HUN102]
MGKSRMKTYFVAIAVVFLVIACTGNREAQVKYSVAHNYFFNNDAEIPTALKITSRSDFERYFGESAVMGKDGEPTKIDFSRQFVIAKMLPETDRATELVPTGIAKRGKTLRLRYTLKQGEKQTWSSIPLFILILDKKYEQFEVVESAK